MRDQEDQQHSQNGGRGRQDTHGLGKCAKESGLDPVGRRTPLSPRRVFSRGVRRADPISGWGTKIPHAVKQRSTPATTREKPVHRSKRSYVLQLKPSADK